MDARTGQCDIAKLFMQRILSRTMGILCANREGWPLSSLAWDTNRNKARFYGR